MSAGQRRSWPKVSLRRVERSSSTQSLEDATDIASLAAVATEEDSGHCPHFVAGLVARRRSEEMLVTIEIGAMGLRLWKAGHREAPMRVFGVDELAAWRHTDTSFLLYVMDGKVAASAAVRATPTSSACARARALFACLSLCLCVRVHVHVYACT